MDCYSVKGVSAHARDKMVANRAPAVRASTLKKALTRGTATKEDGLGGNVIIRYRNLFFVLNKSETKIVTCLTPREFKRQHHSFSRDLKKAKLALTQPVISAETARRIKIRV